MIDLNMKKFISQKLKISEDKAFILQKKFYKNYGTTLFGLMKDYKIKPEEFLDYVHDIDFSRLKKSRLLKQYLIKLPGEKILFTNGDEKYAKKVLTSLGIEKIFQKIFDIKKANYIPKPKKKTYQNLLEKFCLNPKRSVFFEDIEKNLKPAHDLGIITVHIDIDSEFKKKNQKKHVDFKFKCIKSALRKIIQLLGSNK